MLFSLLFISFFQGKFFFIPFYFQDWICGYTQIGLKGMSLWTSPTCQKHLSFEESMTQEWSTQLRGEQKA